LPGSTAACEAGRGWRGAPDRAAAAACRCNTGAGIFFSASEKRLTNLSGMIMLRSILALRSKENRGVFRVITIQEVKMATAKKAKKSAAKKPAAKKPAAKKAAPKKAAAKKPAAKKAPAKKPAAKKPVAKKPAAKRKPNPAFMKPMTPSSVLAAVVGAIAQPRTEITKKIWDYIKKNKLQDAINKRMINADEKLKAIFGGKSQVSMFEMTKLVNKHLK
jgi:chromatin remodeling complex protein RSC6